MMIAAVFAVCVLALIGSFADAALARSGILFIGSGEDGAVGFDSLAATLAWAVVANIAVCAGVAILVYWFFTRPSGEIIELRPKRRKR